MQKYIPCTFGKGKQRTNCPVNAHLISGPTISTKTSFAQFDIVIKYVKVNSGFINYTCIYFVKLEYIMPLAKFQDHRTISSVREDI